MPRQDEIMKTMKDIFLPKRTKTNQNKPLNTNKIMEQNKNTKEWTAKAENSKESVKPGASKIHNLIIVDESGSMSSLYNAALTGMNETLETIRQLAKDCPGQKQEVTLVTFDTGHYNQIFKSAPVEQTRVLTPQDYRPRGGTPLYDAMGKALTDLEPEVKEKEAVLVTVITDGYENASCEFSLADIRALVERLDSAGWVFTYIGANQDSAAVGASMGIADTLDFKADEVSMKQMWEEERNARVEFANISQASSFCPKEYKRGKFFKH